MPLNPSDISELVIFLSSERLSVLKKLTGSDEKAIELHQETLRFGTSFMTLIASIEIAIRNSVCHNLSQYFGVANWLIQPPVPFAWKANDKGKIVDALDKAKRSEYSKLSQAQKNELENLAYPKGRPKNTSHERRAKDRRRHIKVTEGKVVAELTFHFWKRLFGAEYEQTLWRTSLKKIFPNKKITRSQIAIQLEHIYQARNRLAHHEPVLHKRYEDTIAAIEFIINNLGNPRLGTSAPLAMLLANDLNDVKSKADRLHALLNSFRSKS